MSIAVRLRITSRLVHVAAISIFFASGTAKAASIDQSIGDVCATEISMLCAGQEDIGACLKRQADDLTAKCRDALSGKSQRRFDPHISSAAVLPIAASEPAEDDEGDEAFSSFRPAPMAGLRNIWIDQEAKGAAKPGYPKYQDMIVVETRIALRTIADRLTQPGYRAGFSHPLRIRAMFQPADDKHGFSREMPSDKGWNQQVVFNMAMWDDCPSRPMAASVVRHELTHAVIHDALSGQKGNPLPLWFDEGVAMLLGGDPEETIALDVSYRVYGPDYTVKLTCQLDNFSNASNGGSFDCYPYYFLAVRYLDETFPGVLAKIIADLKTGQPIHASIEKRTGQDWMKFIMAVDDYVNTTYAGMSRVRKLTGRRWWWYMRWCQ